MSDLITWVRFAPVAPQAEPGEVTHYTLYSAIAATAQNPMEVDELEITVSNPSTQREVQVIIDKLNELIAVLKSRRGILDATQ